jgi:5-oxoprolinase (ATP-hydrolysing)
VPADSAHKPGRWTVALDTGGTFTDLVGVDPAGALHRAKVPSDGSLSATALSCSGRTVVFRSSAAPHMPDGFLTGWIVAFGNDLRARVERHAGDRLELDAPLAIPADASLRLLQGDAPSDAPRIGLHLLTGTPRERELPPMELRLSTTRGTNALLEGKGARVGVLVSEGLGGIVSIGDQTREDLFARVPRRTHAIARAARELPERTLADGRVERMASAAAAEAAALELREQGCDAIVVSLAHALAAPREEAIVSALASGGITAIGAASVAQHPRLLTRTETACVHAQIAPILDAFVADAVRDAPSTSAFLFTSAGVLQRADRFVARDTLYSGPAGGARAIVAVAARHGIDRAVGFDMGGTSSDVSRVAGGAVALRSESRIGRRTVAAPSVAIDSVAAGGGSVCRVRDGAFEVGPDSAGANPGPACYGRGGPLTISDVNLLAGRFAGDGLHSIALDAQAAERALGNACEGRSEDRDALLAAFLDIANARMALAIETLCVRDGLDPRGHALVAFGGAGGQHACAIADALAIDRIVFPRHAGFMCAHGVLHAEAARFATTSVERPLDEVADALDALHAQARAAANRELALDGFEASSHGDAIVALRLAGQDATIEVAFGSAEELRARFRGRFEALFGYPPPERAIVVASLRVRVAADVRHQPTGEARPPAGEAHIGTARLLSQGARREGGVFLRGGLAAGNAIDGPAIVVDLGETVVVDAGWRATVDRSGDLVAERVEARAPRASHAEAELFAARLEAIALAMGHVLERTALSPNIRDRLDFSCAVLDASGTLIQNAPHLPVHLGALGVCTRAVMRALELGEGDIAVTNHPAFGGSHLPDVTTVAPVFVDGARVGFVAVRAHHAEIGGTRPGSFPPDARSLSEEGVVLPPFFAVRGGALDVAGCRARFADAPHPSRNPGENLADLEAQIAATRHGVAQVASLARELGASFAARCEGELVRAERAIRRAIAANPPETRLVTRMLDDGTPILARVASDGARLRIEISSPIDRHPGNFNTPFAVTQAATIYALRLFANEPVPMNEGLLRAVDLVVAPSMLAPAFEADPARCPPVVAGNVETSQTIVALLVEALGLAAESQSTMNNVLFGNASFGVYETLGGGAGAGPHADGASAVHVHMSNTRLTDVDILERRAPVVIREFRIREGSGGAGLWRGGDGLVRGYEFLAPVSLSFFGSRRLFPPRGAFGGSNGRCGTQRAIVAGAAVECESAVLSLEFAPGDRFTVETPGGGGFGNPADPEGWTRAARSRDVVVAFD